MHRHSACLGSLRFSLREAQVEDRLNELLETHEQVEQDQLDSLWIPCGFSIGTPCGSLVKCHFYDDYDGWGNVTEPISGKFQMFNI